MKNYFIVCALSFICFFPQNVSSKVKDYNYIPTPSKTKKLANCYQRSNVENYICMRSCISFTSPKYIVEGCSKMCAKKVNSEYFNCLLKNKYVEEESW